ncbi:MAG TPA: methyltransferase domain-containing protein [Dehalococcoidia bacterium]|nr:methyltransferase domain-containing protein [Dehalococcoidia bacterium]
MPQSIPWHEDDTFWETFEEAMFSRRRWEVTPVEVDSIISLLNIQPGISVLDLGCGSGRHSLELARRGFHVTGVDRTRKYLDEAVEQAKKEGLGIEFVQEDMRTFCQPDAFDAVINLFTSFSYFEDPEEDRQIVINVHHSLKSGGVVLLETVGKEVLARIF